jgi:6-phosphogluconolactonase
MTASTEVKIFTKPKKVAKRVAKQLLKMTQRSPQPRFDVALSGGSTPKKLFKILSEKYKDTIPWERIHFWWGDERCVPPNDEESNFKMANDMLFSKIAIPQENIHPIKGEEDPENEAIRYAEEITANLNLRDGTPVFDMVLLGMGDDGHTASIFPGRLELIESEQICAVAEHPSNSQKRITLTGKVINNASLIFFLVTGKNKALRLSEIMNDDKAAQLLPAYHISPKFGKLVWYIDEAAYSKIE